MKRVKSGGKVSIRTIVISVTLIAFLFIFVVLYLLFSSSMKTILKFGEEEAVRDSAYLAQVALQLSVDPMSGATSDWSARDDLSKAVAAKDPEKIETYIGATPFRQYRLGLAAVTDCEGNVLYQGYYDFEKGMLTKPEIAYEPLYEELAQNTLALFASARDMGKLNPEMYGKTGFLEFQNQTHYVSCYPVLDPEKGCVGTLVFGRVIDEREVAHLVSRTEHKYGVRVDVIRQLSLEPEQRRRLEQKGSESIVVSDEEHVRVYQPISDMDGKNTIALVFEGPRSLYRKGAALLNSTVAVMTVCCFVVLWLMLTILNRLVINPVDHLVTQINHLDFEDEDKETLVAQDNSSKDMNLLTGAINLMLGRINTSRRTIAENREKIKYQARHDALTGLLNRPSMVQVIQEGVSRNQNDLQRFSLFYVHIQRFKFINDTFGHEVGDQFIIEIARRLQASFKNQAVLARVGGVNILLYVPGLRSKMEQHYFAEQILEQFKIPFCVEERELAIRACVGSGMFPEDGQEAEALIKNAEIAMLHAKVMGESVAVSYRQELQAVAQRKIMMENQMRTAINEGFGEFRAFFQPKVSVQTGQIEGCEALMRWVSAEGMVGPDEFIPLAEDTGLIVPLSWWMIQECYMRCKAFSDHGLDCDVSINISAQVLLHNEFLAVIKETAHKTAMSLQNLDVEIIESTLLEDMQKVNMVLQALAQMGVEVSVDDFGTGYSSLSYLNKLDVDRIKIDRSFVMKIEEGEQDQAIIKAIVAMAKSLDMVVTAEGVETVEQYRFLRDIGCDEVQGYLISRPVPPDEFLAFAARWNRGERPVDLNAGDDFV